LKSSGNDKRGFVRGILVLVLVLLVVGAVYYIFTRNSSIQNAFHSIRESTQDAATTSRVRTALLLSKQVSPSTSKCKQSRAKLPWKARCLRSKVKTVAGAIARTLRASKSCTNNLSVNPSIERNPDREHLGERVADLEIKTLVADALSEKCGISGKTHHHRSEGSSGDTRRKRCRPSVQKTPRTNRLAGSGRPRDLRTI